MISDNARSGMQQAPARSLFNALGFTAEELKKPMVGIVSSYNEIVPGHMNIDKIVNAVKLGVAEAGGVPVVVSRSMKNFRKIAASTLSLSRDRLDIRSPWFPTDREEMISFTVSLL